jgi:hypothetical protein
VEYKTVNGIEKRQLKNTPAFQYISHEAQDHDRRDRVESIGKYFKHSLPLILYLTLSDTDAS